VTQKGFSIVTPWLLVRLLRFLRHGQAIACLGFAVALLAIGPSRARADQVEMQNGDRYVGNVLSLSADTLVLQNEVLGTVNLPRSRVSYVRLGAVSSAGATPLPSSKTAKARVPSAAGPAASTNSTGGFSQLGAHTNLIRQVQKQFLADAGPEANQKFDELLSGLMSGKLTVNDLRAQAQSAADQLREMKRQGGEGAGFATDTYLTILDHFLKETAPSISSTNAIAPSTAIRSDAAQTGD
jgi:hypothetical protein